MIVWHSTGRSALALTRPPLATRRKYSLLLDHLSNPVQSYVSQSDDPYLNLSIEHYLLQQSAPESAVLFLYVNRPSIIIGRNQNPWLEVNLALLDASQGRPETEPPGIGAVDLVRRRSGGGTVFHDQGNVNWTVICPPAGFTRDKHAEMVVRGLRSCGIARARVNHRHDIVLDQGKAIGHTDHPDTHRSPFQVVDGDGPSPLKVSGSAYKLTRTRALHHGTCLLSSPNLNTIPHYLHSPAKGFITARGVQSVSSPVSNILLSNDEFMDSVQRTFHEMYGHPGNATKVNVGNELLNDDLIRKGYGELQSPEWTYLQTPQFTLSSESELSLDVNFNLSVRYGAISDGYLGLRKEQEPPQKTLEFGPDLLGRRLHEIASWDAILQPYLDGSQSSSKPQLPNWLEKMIPRPKISPVIL